MFPFGERLLTIKSLWLMYFFYKVLPVVCFTRRFDMKKYFLIFSIPFLLLSGVSFAQAEIPGVQRYYFGPSPMHVDKDAHTVIFEIDLPGRMTCGVRVTFPTSEQEIDFKDRFSREFVFTFEDDFVIHPEINETSPNVFEVKLEQRPHGWAGEIFFRTRYGQTMEDVMKKYYGDDPRAVGVLAELISCPEGN